MSQQVNASIENNFTGGLKTEFTGLNFPENACTSTENCVFSLIGDVTRRLGIDYETNYSVSSIGRSSKALSTFIWTNAGGDGGTKVYVVQVGGTLYFYQITNATISNPLSKTILNTTVNLLTFAAGSFDTTSECQFTSGNGYLFVFQPTMNPIYCTFTSGVVTPFIINIQVRDFSGIPETGVPDNLRPPALSNEHLYNLQNQGWNNTASSGWSAATNPATIYTLNYGNTTFTVASGISGVSGGQLIVFNCYTGNGFASGGGTVVSYSGTSLVVNITTISSPFFAGDAARTFTFTYAGSAGQIATFFTAATSQYPSNADVWWSFNDSTDTYNPSTTLGSVTLGTGPAPKGYYILPAFSLTRGAYAGISGLTDVITAIRPRTGAWFQGRVWYAGADSSFSAAGDEPFYTWTENIYFSQIVVNTTQFGKCYQLNDPTSETLFNLLPTDGGVITIPGSGSIYKLFPIQNGMLVFAANGVWFITGSSGIGFTADDYNITKISGVRSISGTSFVDVNGLPMFWNEEGIYAVQPVQAGSGNKTNEQYGLSVNPLTIGTILTYYNKIPLQSKKYVRGDYNPLTYVLKWVYRSTNETDVTSRYQFDSFLNFNTANKAFYPYFVTGTPYIHDVSYVEGPGGSTSPASTFKYLTSVVSGGSYNFTFSEENNTTYSDWFSFDNVGVPFTSYFVTGYKLPNRGQGLFQPMYIYMYSNNAVPTSYFLQGQWEYALAGNSGKFSTQQRVDNNVNTTNFGRLYRRHRIRGHGNVLQLKVSSVPNKAFDIMGWSIFETVNVGP